ncbi:MAG: RagB/SusD family nutrient uptake outer membrane protein [Dysgonamonadaceae bacterium]|jgi:hypothetical protein|nr:RagB/SusD family nutrient uptake outer membrane protein [Dysgonamonadaceae bacterium]
MKRYKYLTIIGLSSLLALASCDEYEEVPIERFTIDYVFSQTDSLGKNAEKYLNTIYNAMPYGHNRVGDDYLDAASDDAITSALSENDIQRLASGQYTASSPIGADMYWGSYYTAIRQAITFINHIDEVPLMMTFTNGTDVIPMNRAWKAEARFLKAFFYFELVKRYGGVPILRDDAPYELGEDIELPRKSFEYCIQYIVDELEAIKDSLRRVENMDMTTEGHVATQGAAMALKSRVLLYAASPLFNENPIEANNNLVGYTEYKPERWKEAADAARDFINTYNKTTPRIYNLAGNVGSTLKGFQTIFLDYYGSGSGLNKNTEVIFFHQGNKSTNIEKANGPVGFTGVNQSNGRTSPTQNLVDAFPMLDGKPIGESGKYTYNPQSPYEKRDPRLDYTIMHNGTAWLGVPLQTYNGGVHNPGKAAQTTRTSYYLRKFMGAFAAASEYSDVLHTWVMFRYAEILLNFAEAENEYAGPTREVYDAIVALRTRAQIEAGTDKLYGLKANMTKEEMRNVIRNERRIELAFEEHRYWDIRRWRIAEDVFSQPLEGMSIASNSGLLTFSRIPVASYSFETKRYLYPIPYSEVLKNRNMVQNPEW